jgi:VRR-NUC domain
VSAASLVAAFYRSAGCTVYPFGDNRRARTAIVGVPDLYVVHPRLGAWWHEAKGKGDRVRPAQAAFMDVLHAAGIPCLVGGVDEARAYLTARGLLRGAA